MQGDDVVPLTGCLRAVGHGPGLSFLQSEQRKVSGGNQGVHSSLVPTLNPAAAPAPVTWLALSSQ